MSNNNEEKPPISAVLKTEMKCPNCEMRTPHEYTKENYTPVYSKCRFCNTLYLWKRHKTVEVIPADRKSYVVNLPMK